VIVHRLGGRLAFGELDGRPSPRLERLQAAFASAGVAVEVSKDITRVLWEKYLLICAQAGMTALTRAPIGVIRSTAETWRMYRRLVEELAALALASGVRLAPDVVDSIMRDAGALAPSVFSSLHTDLAQGRRLELEALHGHAMRLGERLGVATPMLFAVYAALRPHADGATQRGAPE
jgi:2-dehydropantoate 2-reductase